MELCSVRTTAYPLVQYNPLSPSTKELRGLRDKVKLLKKVIKSLFDRYFERQLELAVATKLPLFLHCRNSATDLVIKTRFSSEPPKFNPPNYFFP